MRQIRYHWKFGRHSNIPRCCCLWFIGLRLTVWPLNARLGRCTKPPVGGKWYGQYRPCPLCQVTGYKRPIHWCRDLGGALLPACEFRNWDNWACPGDARPAPAYEAVLLAYGNLTASNRPRTAKLTDIRP